MFAMLTFARRRVLVAPGGSAVLAADAAPARAADTYASNTELYANPALVEGIDYGRRYRRHLVSDGLPVPHTVILALHGGGIERGTSELCLAVAGYHPATSAVTPDGGPVYDYWMFEGLRSIGNAELHVTSIHCDDPVAELLCAGTPESVSLHGCTPAQAGLPDGTPAVLVGGLASGLKNLLLAAYSAAGVPAFDATTACPALDGSDPRNIVNRTFTGRGAQLELTTPLRDAMFGTNTIAERKNTTTAAFWQFVTATREALA